MFVFQYSFQGGQQGRTGEDELAAFLKALLDKIDQMKLNPPQSPQVIGTIPITAYNEIAERVKEGPISLYLSPSSNPGFITLIVLQKKPEQLANERQTQNAQEQASKSIGEQAAQQLAAGTKINLSIEELKKSGIDTHDLTVIGNYLLNQDFVSIDGKQLQIPEDEKLKLVGAFVLSIAKDLEKGVEPTNYQANVNEKGEIEVLKSGTEDKGQAPSTLGSASNSGIERSEEWRKLDEMRQYVQAKMDEASNEGNEVMAEEYKQLLEPINAILNRGDVSEHELELADKAIRDTDNGWQIVRLEDGSIAHVPAELKKGEIVIINGKEYVFDPGYIASNGPAGGAASLKENKKQRERQQSNKEKIENIVNTTESADKKVGKIIDLLHNGEIKKSEALAAINGQIRWIEDAKTMNVEQKLQTLIEIKKIIYDKKGFEKVNIALDKAINGQIEWMEETTTMERGEKLRILSEVESAIPNDKRFSEIRKSFDEAKDRQISQRNIYNTFTREININIPSDHLQQPSVADLNIPPKVTEERKLEASMEIKQLWDDLLGAIANNEIEKIEGYKARLSRWALNNKELIKQNIDVNPEIFVNGTFDNIARILNKYKNAKSEKEKERLKKDIGIMIDGYKFIPALSDALQLAITEKIDIEKIPSINGSFYTLAENKEYDTAAKAMILDKMVNFLEDAYEKCETFKVDEYSIGGFTNDADRKRFAKKLSGEIWQLIGEIANLYQKIKEEGFNEETKKEMDKLIDRSFSIYFPVFVNYTLENKESGAVLPGFSSLIGMQDGKLENELERKVEGTFPKWTSIIVKEKLRKEFNNWNKQLNKYIKNNAYVVDLEVYGKGEIEPKYRQVYDREGNLIREEPVGRSLLAKVEEIEKQGKTYVIIPADGQHEQDLINNYKSLSVLQKKSKESAGVSKEDVKKNPSGKYYLLVLEPIKFDLIEKKDKIDGYADIAKELKNGVEKYNEFIHGKHQENLAKLKSGSEQTRQELSNWIEEHGKTALDIGALTLMIGGFAVQKIPNPIAVGIGTVAQTVGTAIFTTEATVNVAQLIGNLVEEGVENITTEDVKNLLVSSMLVYIGAKGLGLAKFTGKAVEAADKVISSTLLGALADEAVLVAQELSHGKNKGEEAAVIGTVIAFVMLEKFAGAGKIRRMKGEKMKNIIKEEGERIKAGLEKNPEVMNEIKTTYAEYQKSVIESKGDPVKIKNAQEKFASKINKQIEKAKGTEGTSASKKKVEEAKKVEEGKEEAYTPEEEGEKPHPPPEISIAAVIHTEQKTELREKLEDLKKVLLEKYSDHDNVKEAITAIDNELKILIDPGKTKEDVNIGMIEAYGSLVKIGEENKPLREDKIIQDAVNDVVNEEKKINSGTLEQNQTIQELIDARNKIKTIYQLTSI